ncbi:MAG: hypothetical protein WA728_36565, partial [Xanthobacteraceae bacterium]
MLAFLGFWVLPSRDAAAEQLHFAKRLTTTQTDCLAKLLSGPDRESDPGEKLELTKTAQVATAVFGDNQRTQSVYLFKSTEFCDGSSCLMMIAESDRDGGCRLIGNFHGDIPFIVRHERDHGYRRFGSPCEWRFDGQQYQLVHGDCRT